MIITEGKMSVHSVSMAHAVRLHFSMFHWR